MNKLKLYAPNNEIGNSNILLKICYLKYVDKDTKKFI